MLALIKNNAFIEKVSGGSRLELNGSIIMPAMEGDLFDGYSLKLIQPADPVSEDKIILSTRIEVIDGVPKEIHTLGDIDTSISADEVDHERDARIDGGFSFNGVWFQSRPQDRENITGAAVAALAAITAGAVAGNYRWHGGDTDFTWIAEDNSLVSMDAQTMFAFGQAAMAHKQALIFAARALKDLPEIPEDFRDDKYWVGNT